jgi:ATP-dependent Clp protease ATP-binding subunit ClpC
VKEPRIEQTVGILGVISSKYEAHHGVRYTPESLEAAAKLSEWYNTDHFLPDKAIDLLDEAGAVVHMQKAFNIVPGSSQLKATPGMEPEITEQTTAEVLGRAKCFAHTQVCKHESRCSERNSDCRTKRAIPHC